MSTKLNPHGVINIPASLDGSFFRYWFEFLRPFHNLSCFSGAPGFLTTSILGLFSSILFFVIYIFFSISGFILLSPIIYMSLSYNCSSTITAIINPFYFLYIQRQAMFTVKYGFIIIINLLFRIVV